MKKNTTLFFGLSLTILVHGANYYIAPTGSNVNTGTMEKPFATLQQGQAVAQAGDTVYLREGIYDFNSNSDEIGVSLSRSGSSGKWIHYVAYPNEIPIFDFKNMTAAKRIQGVRVTANWIHLKGIEMKNIPQTASLRQHEDWCIKVDGGNNNIFELLNLHHNMGPGIFVQSGGNNLFINCDSHDNYDPNSYKVVKDKLGMDSLAGAPGENADGFGVHVDAASDTGNKFIGCRSWSNADDGWDFISCAASVTVENCWAWGNGYRAGSTPPEPAGNGNGFKVGGFGAKAENAPSVVPRHTVRFCVAFKNRAAGFYQNHHPIANYYYNNTSFDNKSANFNLLGYKDGDASMGILRNNIAFTGKALIHETDGNDLDDAHNSWNMPSLLISNADFESVDTLGVYGKRQLDGSLPNIPFLKLKASSALIDIGVDVHLTHAGTAPDMGAFEYGASPVFTISTPMVGKRACQLNHTISVGGNRDVSGRIQKVNRFPGDLKRP